MGPYRKEFDKSSDTWFIFEAADESDKNGQGGQIGEVQTEKMADVLIAGLSCDDDAVMTQLAEWLKKEHGELAMRVLRGYLRVLRDQTFPPEHPLSRTLELLLPSNHHTDIIEAFTAGWVRRYAWEPKNGPA